MSTEFRRAHSNADFKIGLVVIALLLTALMALVGVGWVIITHLNLETIVGVIVATITILGIGFLIQRSNPKEFWF